jgi:hypothetical protein
MATVGKATKQGIRVIDPTAEAISNPQTPELSPSSSEIVSGFNSAMSSPTKKHNGY